MDKRGKIKTKLTHFNNNQKRVNLKNNLQNQYFTTLYIYFFLESSSAWKNNNQSSKLIKFEKNKVQGLLHARKLPDEVLVPVLFFFPVVSVGFSYSGPITTNISAIPWTNVYLTLTHDSPDRKTCLPSDSQNTTSPREALPFQSVLDCPL